MPVTELVPAETRTTMRARTDWGDLLNAPLPVRADQSNDSPGTSP
jgi:hypothetical protein